MTAAVDRVCVSLFLVIFNYFKMLPNFRRLFSCVSFLTNGSECALMIILLLNTAVNKWGHPYMAGTCGTSRPCFSSVAEASVKNICV